MCVIDVYVDRYPDGFERQFERTTYCRYGRPCSNLRTQEHPPRRIQYNEISTETMLGRSYTRPETPPRTPGGSPLPRPISRSQSQRRSYLGTSPNTTTTYIDTTTRTPERARPQSAVYLEDGRVTVELRNSSSSRRQQRRRGERIVMSDGPPTPQLSPRFPQSDWATPRRAPYVSGYDARTPSPRPSRSPAYVTDASPRGRPAVSFDTSPIVINQARPRASSVEAVVGERSRRSRSRSPVPIRNSSRRPSVSVSRAEREAAHNDEILRRPTIRRTRAAPVIVQSNDLPEMVSNLDISGRLARDRYDIETANYRSQQAMNDRLRERQVPAEEPVYRYAFSGPRTRITNVNGVTQWA